MTEMKVDYTVYTKTKQVGVKWVRCPQCSMVFGYETDGGARLRVGKLKVKSMSAECGDCGETIWWYSTDRRIRNLTKRTPSPP